MYPILLAAAVMVILPIPRGECVPRSVLPVDVMLQVGHSEVIECNNLSRTAVGDPLVADVAVLSTSEILINGKSPGKTVVFVWDARGRRIFKVQVDPEGIDLAGICDQIAWELQDSRISVRGVGNTIILEGVVSREAEASRAEAIALAVVETSVYKGVSSGTKSAEVKSAARPEAESFVIERISEQKDSSVGAEVGLRVPRIANLIQVERSIDEVSVRTLETAAALRQAFRNDSITTRALPGSVVLVEGKVGTDAELDEIDRMIKGWEKQGEDDKGMSPSGGMKEAVTMVNLVSVDSSVARQVMVRAQIVDMDKKALDQFGLDWGRVVGAGVEDQPFLIGQSGPGPMDIFGGGDLLRLDPIGARVRALQEQNKAKVLSEPNLLVLDGREANLLVGGEIPVPVVQSSTGGVGSVSISYKEFGVRLKMLPTVMDDDKVQLKVMPEVSGLDYTNAVIFSGFEIPALRTRRAETSVIVRNGQSLVIAGLLQNDTQKVVRKIPLLGDIPIIGELFKSTRFANSETELVIIITPEVIKPLAHAASD